MNPKHPARLAVTILALCLALAMLGGGGWVLFWYWRTGGVMGSSPRLDAETSAAVSTSKMGARQFVPNYLSAKGFIGGARGNWHVNTGPFQLRILQADQALSYDYHFTTQRGAVFTGKDMKLMTLGHDLANNNFIQHDSGVTPDVVDKLRHSPADWLSFELKMSDALARPSEDLWVKYVLASAGSDREKIGNDLIQAVHDACEKALVEDKPGFEADMAQVRALIPPDKETAYLASIDSARKARNARNTSPATRAVAATKPAAPLRPLAAIHKISTSRPAIDAPAATTPSTQP